MEVLMAREECRSGCGIYAVGRNSRGNIISENMIRNVSDCGIYADVTVGTVVNNTIASYAETTERADSESLWLRDKLDESRIQSIR